MSVAYLENVNYIKTINRFSNIIVSTYLIDRFILGFWRKYVLILGI